MAIIDIKEWSPDAADLGNPGAITVTNAVPGVTSYKPLNSLNATRPMRLMRILAVPSRHLTASENVYQYAGNATKLYSLSAGIWGDVSLSPYTTAEGERWEFLRWKEKIIATNFTNNPQSITLGGANFANLTTALRFRHVAAVRDFVVAGYTVDGVDGTVRDRVWWSAINDETDWTPSATTLSDFRDLKTGAVQAIVGGDYGVILTEDSTFRMTFIGSPKVFQIDETVPGVGALMPGGVVRLGDTVFFVSEHGFVAVKNGAQETFIGAGRVDQFFLKDLDADYSYRVSAVSDPSSQRIFWAYPGAGNTGGAPNKILIYDRVFNKWGYAEVETSLLWRSGGVATTLEQLDDLNLGPDLVDNGTFTTDTEWTKGTGWTISGGTATHAAGTASTLQQSILLPNETFYRVQFDVTGRTAGSVTPIVGSGTGTAIVADATNIKETIYMASGGQLNFNATSDFDGSIDNVSLKDVDDLDTMTVSLDSSAFKGSSPLLSAFDSTFASGSFSGAPYTAIFETREVELNEAKKTPLQGFMPVVDGGTVTGRIGHRASQNADVEYTTTLTLRPSGQFTKRANNRYHRFEMTVSGDWTDCIGAQVDRVLAPARGQRRG